MGGGYGTERGRYGGKRGFRMEGRYGDEGGPRDEGRYGAERGPRDEGRHGEGRCGGHRGGRGRHGRPSDLEALAGWLLARASGKGGHGHQRPTPEEIEELIALRRMRGFGGPGFGGRAAVAAEAAARLAEATFAWRCCVCWLTSRVMATS